MRTALALAAAFCLCAQPAFAQTLDAQRRALEALTVREDALQARLDADRHALARFLSALAEFSRDPPPALLVSPKDAKDAVRAMILAKAIEPELAARARALSAEADALDQLRRQAAQKSGDLFAAESALQDRQSRLDAVSSDAELMASPQARQAAGQLQALPAATSLTQPVQGRLDAGFGGRLRDGVVSKGLAYLTAPGAIVRSPAPAVVAYAGPLNGWDQIVILRAGGGRHMVLSGLGKVTVAPGQALQA
ncbi:MAG: murein hydrolase activator EnvC family protein, partial [Caulobacteraceae bacterium]